MKEEKIALHFAEIMKELGLDLSNPSLIDSPKRVAKMYVREIFKGLDENNFPKIMTQPNEFNYNEMIIQKNITVRSMCEHHFVPFIGFAHVAYIPNGKLIGISKLNRIVDFYSSRPQVQEKLTHQIISKLKNILGTEDVAVVLDCEHFCIRLRGIKDEESILRTSSLSGKFMTEPSARVELFDSIGEIK